MNNLPLILIYWHPQSCLVLFQGETLSAAIELLLCVLPFLPARSSSGYFICLLDALSCRGGWYGDSLCTDNTMLPLVSRGDMFVWAWPQKPRIYGPSLLSSRAISEASLQCSSHWTQETILPWHKTLPIVFMSWLVRCSRIGDFQLGGWNSRTFSHIQNKSPV